MSSQVPVRAKDGVSLDHLRYNQIGLQTLCRFLGDGPLYKRYKTRFDTADVAWFVAGAHQDDSHNVEPSTFHQAWHDGRLVSTAVASTPLEVWRVRRDMRDKLKDLVLDATTMLDRLTGGASLWLHVDGTVRPNQPIEVSSLKIDAYVPPHLLREIPGIERPVAQIVQQFAETIGLLATERWVEAFLKTGQSLPERMANPPPPSQDNANHTPAPLICPPRRGSTHYVFQGRRPGELEQVLQGPAGNEANDRGGPPRASQSVDQPASIRDIPSETLPFEEASILRGVIRDLEETIRQKDHEIARLRRALQQGGGTSRVGTPTTVQSSQSIPGPPRTPSPNPIHTPLPLAAGSLTPSAVFSSARSPLPVPPRSPRTPAATPSSAAQGKRPALATTHLVPPARTPASSPINARRLSDSHLTSPVSSPLSTTISISTDWLPVSDNACDNGDFVMPASPSCNPPQPQRRQVNTSSQAHDQSPYTRFPIVGPQTQAVLNYYDLPALLHRDLGEMIQRWPYQEWFSYMVQELELAGCIAEELFDAIMEDTVPESSANVSGR
ncbi:hypothetical protein BV20DRAFT_1055212 [Pilatotrama ljubarskyi]|nr:hypothetical protein BV20DRAFT_1055212 [Pilatotrama ljubarskyi]